MVWKKISDVASTFGKGSSNFGKASQLPPPTPSRAQDVFGKFYALIFAGSILLLSERYLISHVHIVDLYPYRAKVFFASMGLLLIITFHSIRRNFSALYRYSVLRARAVGAALLIGAGSVWICVLIAFGFIVRRYSLEEMFDLADFRAIEFAFGLICLCTLSIVVAACLVIARSRGIKLD